MKKHPFYVNFWTSLIPPWHSSAPPPPVEKEDHQATQTGILQIGECPPQDLSLQKLEVNSQVWLYCIVSKLKLGALHFLHQKSLRGSTKIMQFQEEFECLICNYNQKICDPLSQNEHKVATGAI